MSSGVDEVVSQKRRVAAVRHRLASSPLLRGGGVLKTRMAGPGQVATLSADALHAHTDALEARVDASQAMRDRGNPERWLESAPGGPALDEFATSPAVLAVLRRATGVTWELAGPGSWSYYRHPGHHLGLHRDLAVCDLAVITCVVNDGGGKLSGALRLWPTRASEPLEALRGDSRGGRDLHLTAGDTVLLLGGVVPHCVLPLEAGHVRIVAPICYRVATAPD